MFKSAALLIFSLVSIGAANALAHTWIGVLVTVCVVAYIVFEWLRKGSLSPKQRKAEEYEGKAAEQGLNEIMVSAANGDLIRVKELVNFGVDVNARSISGTTALMYAARNNHLSVVDFLLSVGADIKATSKKGSTATAIAKRSGHTELAAYLEQHGARSGATMNNEQESPVAKTTSSSMGWQFWFGLLRFIRGFFGFIAAWQVLGLLPVLSCLQNLSAVNGNMMAILVVKLFFMALSFGAFFGLMSLISKLYMKRHNTQHPALVKQWAL